MSKKKTKVIDGVRYYSDRPNNCKHCFFWKNRKVGCFLGEENCYYLAEPIKTEQENKCEGCSYAKGQICVSASCYKKPSIPITLPIPAVTAQATERIIRSLGRNWQS